MKLNERVAQAEAALKAARADRDFMRARRRITCACSCGKAYAIGRLHLIVTHFYIEPHGCTGGDYWKEGEWQFVCPTSGIINRLLFDDYHVDWKKRDCIDIAAEPTFKHLYPRHLWGSFEKVHNRAIARDCWINCFDVDLSRRRFELPEKP